MENVIFRNVFSKLEYINLKYELSHINRGEGKEWVKRIRLSFHHMQRENIRVQEAIAEQFLITDDDKAQLILKGPNFLWMAIFQEL